MTPTEALTTYIGELSKIFTFLADKFGDILTLYTTSPVLMLVSGIMITGAVVGLVSRLINR